MRLPFKLRFRWLGGAVGVLFLLVLLTRMHTCMKHFQVVRESGLLIT